MFMFGKKSLANLEDCHDDLQAVMYEAIKYYDFSIICGYRNAVEQFELYKKGRELIGNTWRVKNTSEIVTFIDGKTKKSKHNFYPSLAVDIVPYPIDWNNIDRFKQLNKIIKDVSKKLKIKISWGGEWVTFKDYPHYELKE